MFVIFDGNSCGVTEEFDYVMPEKLLEVREGAWPIQTVQMYE